MRLLTDVVGFLLGALFVSIGMMVLLGLGPQPAPPQAGSPAASFFAAFGPTGYMTFVKVLEIAGGALTAIPKTRCLGLLVLGPIVVNILAFHQLVTGDGVLSPMLLGITGASLLLLWAERRAFLGLLKRA